MHRRSLFIRELSMGKHSIIATVQHQYLLPSCSRWTGPHAQPANSQVIPRRLAKIILVVWYPPTQGLALLAGRGPYRRGKSKDGNTGALIWLILVDHVATKSCTSLANTNVYPVNFEKKYSISFRRYEPTLWGAMITTRIGVCPTILVQSPICGCPSTTRRWTSSTEIWIPCLPIQSRDQR